jgi:hypothetical protein
MKRLSIVLLSCFIVFSAFAQDATYQTFKDTRVVNIHSVETLRAHRLDVRISHRFGDIAGQRGGWPTFYGLETAEDVAIGAEYGVSDNLTIGIYRSKGAGMTPAGEEGLRQLMNGILKFRLLRQRADGGPPVSMSFVGLSSMSTSERITGNDDLVRSFPKFEHRFAFHGGLILARKFSPGLSLQITPGYTHRNLVPFEDFNGLFSLGFGGRVQMTRTLGLVGDITLPFVQERGADTGYYPAVGLGLEIDTGGHVFQVNLTNATGIMETDFIPYTTSSWFDGEFRLGFTISRLFNL